MQIDDQPNISQADLQTLRDKIKNASILLVRIKQLKCSHYYYYYL